MALETIDAITNNGEQLTTNPKAEGVIDTTGAAPETPEAEVESRDVVPSMASEPCDSIRNYANELRASGSESSATNQPASSDVVAAATSAAAAAAAPKEEERDEPEEEEPAAAAWLPGCSTTADNAAVEEEEKPATAEEEKEPAAAPAEEEPTAAAPVEDTTTEASAPAIKITVSAEPEAPHLVGMERNRSNESVEIVVEEAPVVTEHEEDTKPVEQEETKTIEEIAPEVAAPAEIEPALSIEESHIEKELLAAEESTEKPAADKEAEQPAEKEAEAPPATAEAGKKKKFGFKLSPMKKPSSSKAKAVLSKKIPTSPKSKKGWLSPFKKSSKKNQKDAPATPVVETKPEEIEEPKQEEAAAAPQEEEPKEETMETIDLKDEEPAVEGPKTPEEIEEEAAKSVEDVPQEEPKEAATDEAAPQEEPSTKEAATDEAATTPEAEEEAEEPNIEQNTSWINIEQSTSWIYTKAEEVFGDVLGQCGPNTTTPTAVNNAPSEEELAKTAESTALALGADPILEQDEDDNGDKDGAEKGTIDVPEVSAPTIEAPKSPLETIDLMTPLSIATERATSFFDTIKANDSLLSIVENLSNVADKAADTVEGALFPNTPHQNELQERLDQAAGDAKKAIDEAPKEEEEKEEETTKSPKKFGFGFRQKSKKATSSTAEKPPKIPTKLTPTSPSAKLSKLKRGLSTKAATTAADKVNVKKVAQMSFRRFGKKNTGDKKALLSSIPSSPKSTSDPVEQEEVKDDLAATSMNSQSLNEPQSPEQPKIEEAAPAPAETPAPVDETVEEPKTEDAPPAEAATPTLASDDAPKVEEETTVSDAKKVLAEELSSSS